jgi:hypothetical protein
MRHKNKNQDLFHSNASMAVDVLSMIGLLVRPG